MGKKGKKKQQTTGTENETRSQVLQRHKLEERVGIDVIVDEK